MTSKPFRQSGSSFGYSNRPDPIEDPFLLVRCTVPQINYIEILANDLGFDIKCRNAHLTDLCQRPIESIDMLTKNEASNVIGKFKEWKTSNGH